jgi:protoheme IX farnesyltransferase
VVSKAISYSLSILQLIKATISLPVACLSFSGYILFRQSVDKNSWICFSGVFLLAGAASILNQVIERRTDGVMKRTKNRPIPAGRIKPVLATIIAIMLMLAGIIVFRFLTVMGMVLAMIAVLWYLLVYTFVKRVSSFAVLPGAITGALLPLIGWTSAGGSLTSPFALFLSFFVFIWQVPHFWLLMLMYIDEYQAAGFPTIYDYFNDLQVRLWTILWILAACIISLFVIFFGFINGRWTFYVAGAMTLILVFISVLLLSKKRSSALYRFLFHAINLFMFTTFLLLTLNVLLMH